MSRFSVIALLLACSCSTAFGRELQVAHSGKQTGMASKAAEAKEAAIVKVTENVDIEKLMAYKYGKGYDAVPGFGCLRGSIETFGTDNVLECKALCNQDPRCGAITYSNAKARCYLKPHCVPKERKASTTNDSFVKKFFTALSAAENEAYTAALAKKAEEAEKEKAEKEMADKFMDAEGNYMYTGAYENFPKEGCLRGTVEAVFVENMDMCKAKCNEDIRCGAVTFNTEIARCYMKPNCKDGEKKASENNLSARKMKFEMPSEEEIAAFLAKKGEETTEEETEEEVEEEVEEVAERPKGMYKFDQGKRCVPPAGEKMLSQSAVEKTVDCRTACDEDPNCTSYAFRSTNKMCRLFKSCAKMVADPSWFTASRTN